MNCVNVISQMGFTCREIGGDTLRIWSPFTYGDDGDVIALYVEKMPQGYRVTDNCESLMHASAMGISLTTAKLEAVRGASTHPECLTDGGEIVAYVDDKDVGVGVARVLNTSLAVSHFESRWKPRIKSDTFTKTVGNILEESFGSRLLRNVTVTGASGHQLELPLALQTANNIVYLQPISTNTENKIDWKSIYAGFGRMADLKQAGIPEDSRVIILEEAINQDEMKSAFTLLNDSANVVQFKTLMPWAIAQRDRIAA